MDNNENNNVTPTNVTNQEPVTQELPIVADPTAVVSTTNSESTSAENTTIPTEDTTSTSEPEQTENRMTNPGVIGNISPTKEEDPNGVINENLKKVEINYTPPSKGKTFALILFFIFMIAFIIFLPDITTMVNKFKSGEQGTTYEEITTGKLTCTLNSNTTNLDKNYKLVFSFTDNKLERLNYTITTKGDPSLDASTLDGMAESCKSLKSLTSNVDGMSVDCDYSEGKLVETQTFQYASLDVEELDAAYAESGGNHPQYTNGQDMDVIEKNMNASGYSCNRER